MAPRPRGLQLSGSIARRTCATGVQAARRHSGEVAAHVPGRGASATAHPHPPAWRSRRRTTGGGTGPGRRHREPRSALWPPNLADFGHPEGIARRNSATGLQAYRCVVVGVPVKWRLADVAGVTGFRSLSAWLLESPFGHRPMEPHRGQTAPSGHRRTIRYSRQLTGLRGPESAPAPTRRPLPIFLHKAVVRRIDYLRMRRH
jgi:hypothetical protein